MALGVALGEPCPMRRAREIWIQIVGQYEKSGLTQEAFATQRGMPVGTLRWWIWRLRQEQQDAAPLLPVRVIPSTAPVEARRGEAEAIEVEVDERIRVRFPLDTSPAAIAEVVLLLRARC